MQRQLPHAMIIDVSFAGNYAQYDRDSQNLGIRRMPPVTTISRSP